MSSHTSNGGGAERIRHEPSLPARTRSIVPPIYQSTIFALDDVIYRDIRENEGLGQAWYTRFGNPTVQAPADEIARLEGADAGVMTASGMAAIATTLVSLCRAGDRIVSARQLYGDTRDLFVRDLPALGVRVDLVDADDLDAWREALGDSPVAVAYGEALSNPQLRLLDVPAVAEVAHAAGARLVVDNTFASPYTLRPLAHGADVVIDSVSKFLNGHTDVVAGFVGSTPDVIREVQRRLITFGACLDPHAAFLVSRSLKTFSLRLARQSASAERIAAFLEARDDVESVIHPSLPSYPGRTVADRLLFTGRTGAIVTFVVAGGDERGAKVLSKVTVATEATSLGGVETLISTPITSSHFSLTDGERARAGIEPGMIRLSVGLEDADLLIEDLGRALDASVRAG